MAAIRSPGSARVGVSALLVPLFSTRSKAGHRYLPSVRSLLVGWAIVALAVGAYVVARQSSVFAIRRIEVAGAPADVARQVQRAAERYRGVSLVGLDGTALLDRIAAIPSVYAPRYDRAFPNTLRLVVRTEQPVAVLRRGRSAWLVSARGRVLAGLPLGRREDLPRIWLPSRTDMAVGAILDNASGGAAARSLKPLTRSHFPGRIEAVTLKGSELAFKLRSGLELRLGRPADLRLKLAVARRILPTLPRGSAYLDVSVPERPVALANPQVSG
jgi:cell division protein FtsQ